MGTRPMPAICLLSLCIAGQHGSNHHFLSGSYLYVSQSHVFEEHLRCKFLHTNSAEKDTPSRSSMTFQLIRKTYSPWVLQTLCIVGRGFIVHL
ncbi:uncharacterized protein B0I36DRAFT_35687 [Microdochium trichocladiopsis]|uniref:Secreted protein n=1 Tax=Microdochium trichocladiopsis TaxID=1682393 RepID=A0A9P9BMS2_9PEZI|nr:uncharacterized protein B0I36DRAFT_35687 [Microdochium trichocladiopsis]KAH7018092.1 hypothetical protein B0I36DRAFT_35687 [Microdochium trichocladiopsis]